MVVPAEVEYRDLSGPDYRFGTSFRIGQGVELVFFQSCAQPSVAYFHDGQPVQHKFETPADRVRGRSAGLRSCLLPSRSNVPRDSDERADVILNGLTHAGVD